MGFDPNPPLQCLWNKIPRFRDRSRQIPRFLRRAFFYQEKLNRVILIRQFKCIWPTAFFVEVGSAEQALARLKDGLMIGSPFTHAFLDELYSGEETTGTEITRLYRRAEQEQELTQGKTFRAVVVGCTADASNFKHLQSAQEAGQTFVIGKPLPSTDEILMKLSSC